MISLISRFTDAAQPVLLARAREAAAALNLADGKERRQSLASVWEVSFDDSETPRELLSRTRSLVEFNPELGEWVPLMKGGFRAIIISPEYEWFCRLGDAIAHREATRITTERTTQDGAEFLSVIMVSHELGLVWLDLEVNHPECESGASFVWPLDALPTGEQLQAQVAWLSEHSLGAKLAAPLADDTALLPPLRDFLATVNFSLRTIVGRNV